MLNYQLIFNVYPFMFWFLNFSVVSTLLSSLALYLGTLNAAKILHGQVLFNILRVPLTTFFDVTPLGRILNRFSKDVDTLDNVLPMTLRGWVMCLYSVSSKFYHSRAVVFKFLWYNIILSTDVMFIKIIFWLHIL